MPLTGGSYFRHWQHATLASRHQLSQDLSYLGSAWQTRTSLETIGFALLLRRQWWLDGVLVVQSTLKSFWEEVNCSLCTLWLAGSVCQSFSWLFCVFFSFGSFEWGKHLWVAGYSALVFLHPGYVWAYLQLLWGAYSTAGPWCPISHSPSPLAPGCMLQPKHWVTWEDSDIYVAFVGFIYRAWFESHSPELICAACWRWGYTTPTQRSIGKNVAWSPSCGKLLELYSCDTEEKKSSIHQETNDGSSYHATWCSCQLSRKWRGGLSNCTAL